MALVGSWLNNGTLKIEPTGIFTESGYRKDTNIDNLNYLNWVPGTSGSQAGFSQNGSTTENFIITGTDPFGKSVPIWEARPDAVSGADGGWNSSSFFIDNTKMYRFSVWIRRAVHGNGSTYLGVYGDDGNGSNIGVLQRSNGANNTNPYFLANGWYSQYLNEWLLVVGHVWPAGSGSGSSYFESGVYRQNGQRIDNTSDYVWNSTNLRARHRSYLYYSTDISTRQQWAYPRVDKMDGTEPSLQSILSGYDSYTYDKRVEFSNQNSNKPIEILSTGNVNVNNISEVGVTEGLEALYLTDDTGLNYGNWKGTWNNSTAIVTADGKKGFGYRFRGPGISDHVSIPYNQLSSYTITMWVKSDEVLSSGTNSADRRTLFRGDNSWNPGLWMTFGIIRVHAQTEYRDVTWNGDTNWHQIGQMYDGTTAYVIIDGVKYLGTRTAYGPAVPSSIIIGNETAGGTAYTLNGIISDFRIYKRVLTDSELMILYKFGESGMIQLGKNDAYFQGIIEN